MGGRRRARFDIHNIIGQQLRDSFSPNWILQGDQEENLDAQVAAHDLVTTATLKQRQRQFVKLASNGVVSNVLVLDGLPGSGKSHALDVFIRFLLVQHVKVVATAHSNAGTQMLSNKVIESLRPFRALKDIQDRDVRLLSATREKVLTRVLESGVSDIQLVDPMSLSVRTMQYARKNRARSEMADEYLTLLEGGSHDNDSTRLMAPDRKKRTLPQARAILHREVLGSMLLIGATLFVVSRLAKKDVPPPVIVFDEAAQAGEADTIAALVTQTELKLSSSPVTRSSSVRL